MYIYVHAASHDARPSRRQGKEREKEAGGDLHRAKFYPKENKKEWT